MRVSGIVCSLLLSTVLACTPKGDVKTRTSLFDRLGGMNAIEAVVSDFLQNVKGDARINGKFGNADLPGLQTKLVDQICQAAGGPCVYKGRDMKTTHLGMGLSKGDFDAMVEDLGKSLNKFNVPEAEQKELVGLLAPMEKDIVEAQ